MLPAGSELKIDAGMEPGAASPANALETRVSSLYDRICRHDCLSTPPEQRRACSIQAWPVRGACCSICICLAFTWMVRWMPESFNFKHVLTLGISKFCSSRFLEMRAAPLIACHGVHGHNSRCYTSYEFITLCRAHI